MAKVYIESSNVQYMQLFINAGWEVVSDDFLADLVCFTGGEDVSPDLYGESKHPKTNSWSSRDKKEKALFDKCLDIGKPMVGICRGGQFLNVMCGGKMYQDVEGHCVNHLIEVCGTTMKIFATSTHHQMMIPGPDARLLAYTQKELRKEYMKDGKVVISDKKDVDSEVLVYEDKQCLCFQPHPEFEMLTIAALKEYFFKCIKDFLIK